MLQTHSAEHFRLISHPSEALCEVNMLAHLPISPEKLREIQENSIVHLKVLFNKRKADATEGEGTAVQGRSQKKQDHRATPPTQGCNKIERKLEYSAESVSGESDGEADHNKMEEEEDHNCFYNCFCE